MRHLLLVTVAALAVLGAQPAAAQGDCAAAFDDVRSFTAAFFEQAVAEVEDGVIVWDSTDWENVVRRLVGTSEFYLNNCTDTDQPLADQPEEVAQLAAMSLIEPPVSSVDVGGDFGEVELSTDFEPMTEFVDLDGDGMDELILHTQLPYFSQDTVYQVRGALSVAFFYGDDGWQGQVIAPVSSFVTDEEGDHVAFVMGQEDALAVDEAHEALVYFPGPQVEVIPAAGEGSPLTAITLRRATGTGDVKELNMLTWDGRIPSVALRVALDDWCFPGSELEWEIRDDGSVYVPSNEGEEGSPLHCGRTPEVLFQWEDGAYSAVE